jgi:hypothetical protein
MCLSVLPLLLWYNRYAKQQEAKRVQRLLALNALLEAKKKMQKDLIMAKSVAAINNNTINGNSLLDNKTK